MPFLFFYIYHIVILFFSNTHRTGSAPKQQQHHFGANVVFSAQNRPKEEGVAITKDLKEEKSRVTKT